MSKFSYTEEQINDTFDYVTSGTKRYLEAGTVPPKEGLPPTPEQMDATPTKKPKDKEGKEEKKTPEYKTFHIDDDKVDIDIENELVYINDELVTEETDAPRHIIEVLKKVIPKMMIDQLEGKNKEKEEAPEE